MTPDPFRLGFAVKIIGEAGLKSHDSRRWQSEPSLARSLELLDAVFDYLDRNDLPMYRMSSSTIPYGTHPHLPTFDYRRQIGACANLLVDVGEKARRYGLRLSTHPGQYTVLSGPDPELTRKSSLDLEQDALLLDTMGLGPEAVVVVHVGGAYGEPGAALDRWARAYEALSERARRRVVVENDERTFSLGDVLALHERTGVRVVFDVHHHRCNPTPGLERVSDALAAAYATWTEGRPKIHLSSPRSELRVVKRKEVGRRGQTETLVPPLLEQHADFASPWDLIELLDAARGPVDVMVEAKAKDLAVRWLRGQLARLRPDLAAIEERRSSASPASPEPDAPPPAAAASRGRARRGLPLARPAGAPSPS